MAVRQREDSNSIRLSDVQETLLTPLCARADQLERTDAIVIDPAAKQLVDGIDYDFDLIRRFPNTLTGCAIRAAIMDRWIGEFLDAHPSGTVAILGAGLDTVFERNDRGENSRWFEFDFPDVIELREQCFAADERRTAVAADVTDPAWVDALKRQQNGPLLFQAAGLLMYLQPEQVRLLIKRLADQFPGSTLLFDCCTDYAKQQSERWEATVRTTSANYHTAINDPHELSAWDSRITITDVEYMLDHHRHQWSWPCRIWSRLSTKLRKAYHINRAILGER